jgi:hypothetical protein
LVLTFQQYVFPAANQENILTGNNFQGEYHTWNNNSTEEYQYFCTMICLHPHPPFHCNYCIGRPLPLHREIKDYERRERSLVSSDKEGGEELGAKQDTAIHMVKICLTLK